MAETPDPTRLRIRALGLWLALLALGAAAYAAAVWLDGAWALSVPLAASTVMAILVGLRFMELPRAGAVSLLSALASVLFLAVMFTLTFADEFTRDHVPAGFAPADP